MLSQAGINMANYCRGVGGWVRVLMEVVTPQTRRGGGAPRDT